MRDTLHTLGVASGSHELHVSKYFHNPIHATRMDSFTPDDQVARELLSALRFPSYASDSQQPACSPEVTVITSGVPSARARKTKPLQTLFEHGREHLFRPSPLYNPSLLLVSGHTTGTYLSGFLPLSRPTRGRPMSWSRGV